MQHNNGILGFKKQNKDVPVPVKRLYDYFSTLVSAEDTRSSENYNQETNEHGYDTLHLDRIISDDEIRKYVRNQKNNKAQGCDKILNEYIKLTTDVMLPVYRYLFNNVLETGLIPDEWTIGMIVPIYKYKGCVMGPNNYREITLLRCVDKLLLVLYINSRLEEFVESNDLLSEM